MIKICVHAGHSPYGVGKGAVGLLDESVENRKVLEALMSLFKDYASPSKFTFYDVTVDSPMQASAILNKLNNDVNKVNPDLSISIHLNAAGKDTAGGVECYCYNGDAGGAAKLAGKISNKISNFLGIRDRGVKNGNHLSVIKNVKAPAILIECCFVDSAMDVSHWSPAMCAKAIFDAVMAYYDSKVVMTYPESGSSHYEPENKGSLYRVQVGAFAKQSNAAAMQAKLKEAGFDAYIYEDK